MLVTSYVGQALAVPHFLSRPSDAAPDPCGPRRPVGLACAGQALERLRHPVRLAELGELFEAVLERSRAGRDVAPVAGRDAKGCERTRGAVSVAELAMYRQAFRGQRGHGGIVTPVPGRYREIQQRGCNERPVSQ